ncbi:MAG: GGDEF domain-containing protein [Polyangiales bacterium]
MVTDQNTFRVASIRYLLGFAAIFFLPVLFPGFAVYRPLFVGYLVVCAFMHAMIYFDVGGQWRAILGGVLDVTLVTFVVQRVGTAHTMLVALFIVVAVINTLLVGADAGIAIAIFSMVIFGLTVAAEQTGFMPYAPNSASWGVVIPPSPIQAVALYLGTALMVLLTTGVTAALVRTSERRQWELEYANKQLAMLTRQDPLTKLFNRRHVLATIENELAWVNRGRSLAVVMIDLDGFKRINDTRGHLDGDELLRKIADTLMVNKREVDVAGRYGGDEFVIVLPQTDRDDAKVAATRFVEAIRIVGLEFDGHTPVTASAGISIANADDSIESILERADVNSFAAKRGGGNAVFA